ncbi:unnamed protein product [Oppiella nova]|uniref:DNA/RNA-binding domain-containing protein n=1 Tax=Oppiella nova TaxID=334625 RepID=A0A7R9M8Q2_9ACAR|nr:unnamed protein product [Oppiella nova]CAG2171740.1 unnamed protein product [Oppiella nova]
MSGRTGGYARDRRAVNGGRHSDDSHVGHRLQRSSPTADAIDVSLNGVNNLRPKCEQTYRVIVANVSTDSSLVYEKQLWNDIKQYRHQKDTILIEYLIGFYVSLMEAIVTNDRHKEPYLLFAINSQLSATTRLLLYNILIRIGDLNRYLNKTSIAENYYLRARRLDPTRGHAYNQLAINTPLSQHLKCIYYYCRAAKSSADPIVIAETNLKVAVNRFDSDILKSIIKNGSNVSDGSPDDQQLIPTYPQKGIDWFYLSVISIYSDNMDTILRPLIQFVITNCELTSNKHLDCSNNKDLSFALMAFDVSIDFIALKAQQKSFFDVFAKELKDVKAALKSCSDVLNDSKDSDKEGQSDSHTKALFHDYFLRGFSPLTPIHSQLVFDANETLVVRADQLVLRVVNKLDKLLSQPKSVKPKRMRNVALGSILENDS